MYLPIINWESCIRRLAENEEALQVFEQGID